MAAVADGPGRGLPVVRPDLEALVGYHSAQVDVDVRLNTNESPLPPPEGWLEDLADAVRGIEFNRYPDRQATELRAALAASHGVGIDEVFCANGSNEVLQSLLLAYGGPGRTVALFEPTYTLHRHIASITGTTVAVGPRRDDFALDLDAVAATVAASEPVITFLCSPNNPTGRADTLDEIATVAGLATGCWSWTRPTGSSPRRRRSSCGGATPTGRAMSWWSGPSPRRGRWPVPASATWWPIRRWWPPASSSPCPTISTRPSRLAGRLALNYVDEMERRVAAIAEERGRIAAAFAGLPLETWPSDANFLLFRPLAKPATEVWSDLVASSVLVRDCSTWPGLTGCLRVTVGLPEENDRFLAALTESLR